MRALLAALVVVSALVTTATVSARPAATDARACGAITVRLGGSDFTYRISVVSGRVECATARRVVRRFVADAVVARGWACARGHSRDRWAASCARIAPRALVRAFLVAG